MRALTVLTLLLAGCGLTSYREDRDSLLRELRENDIGPYFSELSGPADPGPAPQELEKLIQTEGLTVEQAVGYALARNPELVSALSHWEMLLERVPQASSFADPMFLYEEYIRPTQTRSGPKERKFAISQKIPWPGKLGLKGEVALEEARKSEQAYRGIVLKLIEQVEHAHTDLALVYRLIEINEELKRIMKGFEEVARKKYEAGKAKQTDVLRAQIQFVHLEHHGIVLERDRKMALEKLNALLNRPSRAPIGTPNTPSMPEFDRPIEELVKLAWEQSPELKRAEHAASKAAAQRSLASLDYLPDFTLGARYEMVEGGTNPGFSKDGDDIFTVTLGINLPLQFERRAAAVSEAEAGVRMARAQYLRIKRDIERDVVLAYERIVELGHEAHLLGETLLPQTRQHLKLAQKSYEAGEFDFLSVLDAEKNIEGIYRDHARVAAEFLKALATLKRAVGGSLK